MRTITATFHVTETTRTGELIERVKTLAAVSRSHFGHIKFHQRRLCQEWPAAFPDKRSAAHLLGSGGSGYSECFHIPLGRWSDALDQIGDELYGLVQG